MKKTMLALMATVGLAFGAKADVLNSTGFENYTGDFAYTLNDSGVDGVPYYWVVTNATPDLSGTVLTAYGESAKPGNVPWAFTNKVNDTYLKVDTSNEVLYRSVEAGSTAVLHEGTEIGDGLYFDANVQFTASDGEPTFDSADKLVVWLKADEENNTTNLMVTAGVYNEGTEKYDPTPFELDGTYFADTWYRLTVKAMVESDVTKFVVYVNDTQVTVGGTAVVFDSLVQTGNAATTLAGVGFQGTGAVDNLVWTTEDPFPVVETTFPMTLTVVDEDSATDTALYVQDAAVTNEFTSGVAVDVLKETTTITIVVGVFDGYEVTDFTKGDSYENNDGDPCTYYTKDVAVTQEMIENGLALTINVTDAGGGEEPTTVEPGGEAHTTTEEAAKAVVVKAPDGSGITDGEAYNTYASYFTQKVTGSGSEWTTTFELNVTGTNAVEAAFADLTDEDAGVLAVVFSDKTTTVTVGVPQGFYWALSQGASLGDMTNAAGQLSTTGSVTVEPNKALGASGFYQLLVSPQQIPAK